MSGLRPASWADIFSIKYETLWANVQGGTHECYAPIPTTFAPTSSPPRLPVTTLQLCSPSCIHCRRDGRGAALVAKDLGELLAMDAMTTKESGFVAVERVSGRASKEAAVAGSCLLSCPYEPAMAADSCNGRANRDSDIYGACAATIAVHSKRTTCLSASVLASYGMKIILLRHFIF